MAYRLKYVGRGRGKFRVMTGMEFMARLAALIAPPRYPLLRYAGVLGPRSAWRRDIVPKPRERRSVCEQAAGETSGDGSTGPRAQRKKADAGSQKPERPREAARPLPLADGGATTVVLTPGVVVRTGDVVALAPNVLSVRHWDRLMGGALYAATPRVDWAPLLRRAFDVDVLECPKCHGRLRVLAVITERQAVRRMLAHLGQPTDAPPLACARDPTDEPDDIESSGQLGLGLA